MPKRKNKDIRGTIHRFPLRQPSNKKKKADETLVMTMVGVGPAGTWSRTGGSACMRQVGASTLLPCLVYRLDSRLLLMMSPETCLAAT